MDLVLANIISSGLTLIFAVANVEPSKTLSWLAVARGYLNHEKYRVVKLGQKATSKWYNRIESLSWKSCLLKNICMVFVNLKVITQELLEEGNPNFFITNIMTCIVTDVAVQSRT